MEWKEVRLGDVCEIKGGKRLPKGINLITQKNSHPYIRVRDLGKSKTLELNSSYEYVDEITQKQIQRYITLKGDILISIVGTIGLIAIVGGSLNGANLTENCVKLVKLDNIDSEYLYYYLKSPLGQQNISRGTVGAVQAKLPIKNIQEFNINCPVLISDQRRIASILSSLDRKIELNNKINADLEEMAQAIFKNWFVDFEPFKDGKFVDSELGMIPEGWKVGRLDEIADVVGGSTPSKAKPEYYTQKGIAWLTPKDLSNHPAVYTSRGVIDITEEGYNSTSTKLMPKGTILFTSRAPIGYISIAQNDICTNQGFKSLVPKKAGTCFLYCFLKYVTPEIENKSTGSTFKEASGSLMKSLQVIMPEQKVFEDFETIVSPLFARIESLEKENSRLSLLRDTLLPRLMSGELEVPE